VDAGSYRCWSPSEPVLMRDLHYPSERTRPPRESGIVVLRERSAPGREDCPGVAAKSFFARHAAGRYLRRNDGWKLRFAVRGLGQRFDADWLKDLRNTFEIAFGSAVS